MTLEPRHMAIQLGSALLGAFYRTQQPRLPSFCSNTCSNTCTSNNLEDILGIMMTYICWVKESVNYKHLLNLYKENDGDIEVVSSIP